MGSSIPLVALMGQQPKITDYQTMQANAEGIQNMRGQNALQPGQIVQQQQQIEAQRRQFADQDALTKTMQDWDGKDLMAIPSLVLKHGGSGQSAIALKSAFINQQKDLTGLNEAQITLADMKADHWLQGLNTVANAPEEQKPTLLEQVKANAIQKGWATPQEAQAVTYQNPQQFSALIKMAQGHKNAIAEAKTQAETEEASSKGALAAAQTPGAQAESTIKTAEAGMLQGGGAGNAQKFFYDQADRTAPPTGSTAALNARTKARIDTALGSGKVEDARKALSDASAEIGSIEKETNPAVMSSKVQVASREAAAKADVEAQVSRGSNAALAEVPPHLIAAATADATKVGQDYAAAKTVSDRMAATMAAARKGNVVSYQIIPQEGTLQITTSQGVHRINKTEIEQYAGGGSLWQRLEGDIGKQLTGKSISPIVLNDMQAIQKIQADGAKSKYENGLKTINQNYGAKFTPVEMKDQVNSPGAIVPTNVTKALSKVGSGRHTLSDGSVWDKHPDGTVVKAQ